MKAVVGVLLLLSAAHAWNDVTTIAGVCGDGTTTSDAVDGVGTNAQFKYALRVAFIPQSGITESSTEFLIADTDIRKLDVATGAVTTFGSTTSTQFKGLAVANDGLTAAVLDYDHVLSEVAISDGARTVLAGKSGGMKSADGAVDGTGTNGG